MSAQEVEDYVEHFRRRVLQDALTEATSVYWERRAEAFEWAKPRPDDSHGQATREELSARWCQLDEIARACRNRARVSLIGGEPWGTELEDVFVGAGETA